MSTLYFLFYNMWTWNSILCLWWQECLELWRVSLFHTLTFHPDRLSREGAQWFPWVHLRHVGGGRWRKGRDLLQIHTVNGIAELGPYVWLQAQNSLQPALCTCVPCLQIRCSLFNSHSSEGGHSAFPIQGWESSWTLRLTWSAPGQTWTPVSSLRPSLTVLLFLNLFVSVTIYIWLMGHLSMPFFWYTG